MPFPNFFLLGAQKAGTSSIWGLLRQHPEVFMSEVKEPMYFAAHDWPELPTFSWFKTTSSTGAYRELFSKAGGARAIGEASTWYLACPWVPSRIREAVPDAKLIVSLRNPVDRAYSQYLMHVRRGSRSMKALRNEIWSSVPWVRKDETWDFGYIAFGRYCEQIRRYLDLFPRDRIWIGLFDDLQKNPVRFAQGIYRHLNVNPSFVPLVETMNRGYMLPNRFVSRLLNPDRFLMQTGRILTPRRLREVLRDRLLGTLTSKPSLPDDLRLELKEYFEPEIRRLEGLIERDLSAWLR